MHIVRPDQSHRRSQKICRCSSVKSGMQIDGEHRIDGDQISHLYMTGQSSTTDRNTIEDAYSFGDEHLEHSEARLVLNTHSHRSPASHGFAICHAKVHLRAERSALSTPARRNPSLVQRLTLQRLLASARRELSIPNSETRGSDNLPQVLMLTRHF